MKTTRFLMAAAMAVSFVGCDDIKGTLNVQQQLTLKDEKGKLVVLQPGAFEAAFDLDEDENERELEIKVKDARGKKHEADLPIPTSVAIPRVAGSFVLTGSQTGQAFDLQGEIQTDERNSGPIDTTESCTYTEPVRRCWTEEFVGRDGRKRRERRCEWVNETRWGMREVTYHTVTTTVRGTAEFVDANVGVIATFQGSNSHSIRYNDYVGRCR